MAHVTVETGPLSAVQLLRDVPKSLWKAFLAIRRDFLAVNLSYDCRNLLKFIDEAKEAEMWIPLGYKDLRDLIEKGLRLQPDMVDWAIQGLEKLDPGEPIAFKSAAALGLQIEVAAAKADPLPKHGTNQYTPKSGGDVITSTRGTSRAYLLRRLARDHPRLLDRISTEFLPRAAAIEAGIIKRSTVISRLIKLWAKASTEERQAFLQKVSP